MDKKLLEQFTLLRELGRVYTQKILDGNTEHKSHLRLSQIKALYAFRDQNCLSMKSLAENIGVKLPNMTMMIENLSEDGIVERGRDELDRRKVIVRLTPKGIKIRENFLSHRSNIATALFSSLNNSEKKELLGSMDSVCRILEKAFLGNKGR